MKLYGVPSSNSNNDIFFRKIKSFCFLVWEARAEGPDNIIYVVNEIMGHV